MKKTKLISLITIIVIMLGIMAITVPDSEKHYTAINDKYQDYASSSDDSKTSFGKISDGLLNKASGAIILTYIRAKSDVSNFGIISLSSIDHDGNTVLMSIGALGNVFVIVDFADVFENKD